MTEYWDFFARALVLSLIILASTVVAATHTARMFNAEPFDQPDTDTVDTLLAKLRTGPRGQMEVNDGAADTRPTIADDISNILEKIPNYSLSATPSSTLSDHDLRDFLYKSRDSATGWKALSEHALSERDVGGGETRTLYPFPAISVDPADKGHVFKTANVKAYDISIHTDLVGTPLSDAAKTSVGSIMPKFEFKELH